MGEAARGPDDYLDRRLAVPDDLAEGRVRAERSSVEPVHPDCGDVHASVVQGLPDMTAQLLPLGRVDQVDDRPADESVFPARGEHLFASRVRVDDPLPGGDEDRVRRGLGEVAVALLADLKPVEGPAGVPNEERRDDQHFREEDLVQERVQEGDVAIREDGGGADQGDEDSRRGERRRAPLDGKGQLERYEGENPGCQAEWGDPVEVEDQGGEDRDEGDNPERTLLPPRTDRALACMKCASIPGMER